jgi:hyperosmotically inducible periplasmic protein
MRRARWTALVGMVALLALCAGAQAATPQARAAFRATMKQANADYAAARMHCRTQPGHARTVCIAEAKATLRKAEADAQSTLRATERARADARVTGAKADYQVDKAKCGDRSGEERRTCLREARGRQSQAMSGAVTDERTPNLAIKPPAVPHSKTP